MSAEHKEALAEGRRQGRAVRAYLEALESHRPKRGRKRTPESIAARLNRIRETFQQVDPVSRLQMAQERIDLQAELANLESPVDLEALEADFVEVAAAYGNRKAITYAAWREIGVPAAVLKRASISRGARN